MTSFMTGRPSLDAVTGGLHPGEFEIRTAAVAHGKTADAFTLTPALAEYGLVTYGHTETPSALVASGMRIGSGQPNAEVADNVALTDLSRGTTGFETLVGAYYRSIERSLGTGKPHVALIVDYLDFLFDADFHAERQARVLRTLRAMADGDLHTVIATSGCAWPTAFGPVPESVDPIAVVAYVSTRAQDPAHFGLCPPPAESLRERIRIDGLGYPDRFVELRRRTMRQECRPDGSFADPAAEFVAYGPALSETTAVRIPMLFDVDSCGRRATFFDPATV